MHLSFPMLRKYLLALAGLIIISGCGYYNPYNVDKSGDITFSVFAPIWKNQTNELGYETVINQSLQDWLSESHQIKLTSNRDDAQYILEGTIVAMDIPGLSYGLFDQATELRAEMIVEYLLREKDSGRIILKQKNLARRQAFRVGKDALYHLTNKEAALDIMADELGEDIYMHILNTLTQTKRYKKTP